MTLVETSEFEMISHLSAVQKCIHGGKIQERFVGFTDVIADRYSDGLFNRAQSVMPKFDLESTLVTQTYGRVSVTSGH
jgi:hypothetical protein